MIMGMFATRIALVLSAVAVAAGGLAACSSAAPIVPISSLNWQPCAENAAYDCVTLPVPIDWSDPGGAGIDIALIRDRADDEGSRVGTLVSLPGGPGSSGVDQILRGAGFSEELRSRFDIVSLDPRGVKRSHPVQCDAGLVTGRPNLDPDNGGRIEEVRSYTRELADSCRAYTGPLIDHLDAMSVARDVEALRIALGENQISLYSRSYGTMPAQAYAELFPQRLRASVLDSVDDHSLDGAGFLATEARGGQDAFAEFAAWCVREAECALRGTDVHALYADLYADAERGALRNPKNPDQRLSPLDLSAQVTQRLYRPEWSALATDLQTLAAQPSADPRLPTRPVPTGKPTDAPQLIFCSDWRFDIPNQATWQSLWRDQSANSPTLRLHFAWGAASICANWPIPPQNPPHRPQVVDGPQLLILSSRHDPSTPREWAVQVAAQTPRTTLLACDGWGHGVYDRTPCTTAAADRYLLDLQVPTAGCPAP